MAKKEVDFNKAAEERRKKYRNRLDVIRNPEINHMSRTKTKHDHYVEKARAAKEGSGAVKGGRRRAKAYDGAFVADPRRQVSSGFKLVGQLMQHIHNFVIDMDLTSLYPSIMLITNLSPKTFVGKIFFKDKIEIPQYEFIKFMDKADKNEYRCNSNDFFFEAYTGKHWWAIGEIYLNLPTTEQVLDYIDDHINQFS